MGKESPGYLVILEGFVHMLTCSTTATGMSLAFDPNWKKFQVVCRVTRKSLFNCLAKEVPSNQAADHNSHHA